MRKKNSRREKKALNNTSFTLDDIKAAKKETAKLILTRCLVLRRRYPSSEVSDEQIIYYVASNYHVDIQDGELIERIGKTGGNECSQ